MKNVLLVAADSIRALLHRRLLLALMLVVLIFAVLFAVAITQMTQANRELAQAMAEAPAPKPGESLVDPSPEAQAMREGMEEALADSDEEQREELQRAMMQETASQMLTSFYGLTLFGGVLVALFIGATALSGDVRSGAIAMVLSKPVARWQFLLGKHFGAMAVLLAYAAVIGGVMAVFTQISQLDDMPAVRHAPWLMFCQMLIYCSLALLFSTLTHPAVAGVLAFFAPIIDEAFASLFGPDNPFWRYLLKWLFPAARRPFDVSSQFMDSAKLLDWSEIGTLTLYALNLMAIYLLLAMWRFRSKAVA